MMWHALVTHVLTKGITTFLLPVRKLTANICLDCFINKHSNHFTDATVHNTTDKAPEHLHCKSRNYLISQGVLNRGGRISP